MAGKPKTKMPIAQRAKQFMPFAALKGLEDALAEKEKIPVTRITLSDELAEELSEKLSKIQKGMIVSVTYYGDEEYIQENGTVQSIDSIMKQMQINGVRISFSDIYAIDIQESI